MKLLNFRLLAIIRKEFIQILRDPRTLILVLGIPIMQLVLMGYAATNDIRNIPLAVFDQDRSPAARRLLDAYRSADYFRIAYEVDSEAELRHIIDSGMARAGIVIPAGYSAEVNGSGSAQVAFILDGSDPTAASTALSAARLIGQQHATILQEERLARYGQSDSVHLPLEIRTQVWYNPDLVNSFFMVPGVIGQILFSLTSVLTAVSVVRERERGTIEQLIVSPIRPWELLVGKLIPYILLALLNTLEVLALGAWLFHLIIRSELTVILLLSSLFLLTGLGLGLLISTLANTQQEAMLGVFMLILPSVYLSGFFFPLEAMPKILQWISYFIPMRYFLVIIRSLLIKGVGVAVLQNEIIALAVFAVVIMTLATLRFRKRLD